MPLTILSSILILLANVALQAWAAGKQKGPKPGTLSDFGIPSIEENRALYLIGGSPIIANPQVLYAGNHKTTAIKQKGGKKG